MLQKGIHFWFYSFQQRKNKIGHSSRSSSIQRSKTAEEVSGNAKNLAFHLLKKDGQKTKRHKDKKEK